MITPRLVSYIVILVFISTETEGNADDVKEYCRFKGDMCDLDVACFKMLSDDYLIQLCSEHKELPPRLLGVEQEMAFEPTKLNQEYTSDNFTYSVYMSNDDLNEDVHLVPGCCNLANKKNDTCRMPAIFDSEIKFFAVFPFRNNPDSDAIYCQLKIEYVNLPLNFCVEGEEVVDPCLEMFEDGDVKIKYRYTPLSSDTISDKIDMNRCYFPLSADVMPDDTTYPTRRNIPNKNGFIVMKPPKSAIVDNVTKYSCTLHEKVDGSRHLEIATDIHNEGGDFACSGIKNLNNDSIYYPDTYCTNMQVQQSSILPIVIPISAFVALLALILCIQVCRTHDKFKKISEDWKKSSSLRFLMKQHEEVKYKDHPTAIEAPNHEEFYDVVAVTEDDTCDIERSTSISHISTSFEKKYDDRYQDKVTPIESTNGEGGYISKCINSEKENIDFDQAGDSGFGSGTGSELGQYCKKSYEENKSEPSYPSSSGDSGYLAKSLIGTANDWEDLNIVEGTLKVDSALNNVNSGSFSSGYTPKYIAKHNALHVDK